MFHCEESTDIAAEGNVVLVIGPCGALSLNHSDTRLDIHGRGPRHSLISVVVPMGHAAPPEAVHRHFQSRVWTRRRTVCI
jgi:hypothetical protein